MFGRQTDRDDRQRDERPREHGSDRHRDRDFDRHRDRGSERLPDGVALAVALLGAVLLNAGRDDETSTERTADGRALLPDAAARVRDRLVPREDGARGNGAGTSRRTGSADTGWTTAADAEWTTRLPGRMRTVATDDRLRKGLPVAGALLAGLVLAGRGGDEAGGGDEASGDDEASAVETSGQRGSPADAVARVRRRMASGGGTASGSEMASGGETTSGGGTAPGGETPAGRTERGDADAATAGSDAFASTGIDADVEDLSPPTTSGMPMLGVGTYRRADYDECLETVRQALQVGYRHVDTTDRRSAYYGEEAVGDAVAESGVDREDVFVATKVTPADLDRVRTSLDESLDRLGMEYVDLLYVHWPTHDYEPRETLEAFAELREEGRVDRIGVSNFTVDLLAEALDVSDAPVFANQVEMHPLLPQEELREFCEDAGVEVVAYSPIARSHVEDVPELREVAEKHGATPEQVSLAWLREKGVTAIPRATSEDHLRENWRSLALDLDVEDVSKLDSIDEHRRIVDPDDAPWH